MLKLTLKPGEYIDIGENIRVVFSGGSANNIHLLIDAPSEVAVQRSSAGAGKGKSTYYKEKGISKEAQREIADIIMREKHKASEIPKEQQTAGKKGVYTTGRHVYTSGNR